jgi:hypothetical protein
MAKQKKKRNKKYKKYRQNYVTGDRVDMRTGGRVSLRHGGPHGLETINEIPGEEEMSIQRKRVVPTSDTGGGRNNVEPKPVGLPRRTTEPVSEPTPVNNKTLKKMPDQPRPRDSMIFADNTFNNNLNNASTQIDNIMDGTQNTESTSTAMSREDFFRQYGNYTGNTRGSAGAKAKKNFIAERQKAYEEYLQSLVNTNPTTTPITANQQQFEDERRKRVIQSGRTAQDIAEGKLPDLPEAEVEKISQEGTTASTVQMDATTPAQASTIAQTAPEQVSQATATTAQTPEQIRASQMEADTVGTQAQVDAAQGQVSDQSVAQAAKVDRVAPVEGAEVEIPEGALTDRVVGSISEGAKAIAAQNAGTSLSRITRAKKQLSRAGLSDSDIQEIGNDPEALEDRLADFSEQERGIIAGLPEEALVSTQLNGLLEGMENGEIPPWAKPAVTQVEQMLATRGLSASSVGRDNLFNAIIQSALPIAQSNAQAIQQSVSQQRNIEAQEAEANAQRMQQTALTNANNVFQMDMAQFSSDQQIALSNSKFLQTVGLTEASNEQQSTIQNAALMSQANLAEADFNQRSQIQNAQAFLQMDMANLTNQQQSNVLKAQQEQQRILSNQAATNAARQFNSASENQTNQFMATLEANINQFNTAQMNANSQFNAQSINAAAARDANRVADVNKANAAILNQVSQFNAQLDFNREQWNSANEQAIVNSNINWRRQSNLADTAAQNAVNQQNAQNAFGLTSSALSFLWQELRDQADYDFKWATDTANRKLNAMIAAASSEGDAAKNWSTNFSNASSTVDRIFGDT